MLFNSIQFAVFLVVVYGLYLRLGHRRQNILLLIASYFFYACWDWRFLSLLLVSTVVDYICARLIEHRPARKKLFLLISLGTNLGILGFFKYFNFFIDSAQAVLGSFGYDGDFTTLSIILPLGISFYTFQTMAYTIDVYRGKERATKDLLTFALYVSYFPQLVAGPIERSKHLLPLLQKPRVVTWPVVQSAVQLMLMGFFKKIFIADGVAPVVDDCFADPARYGGLTLTIGVYLFALQIYGDFAGYTDIARGVSRLFGIELRNNFRQPYLAANITEFWRRWHISLSSWLRDYLYIPLGGNRKGGWRTHANKMITMVIGGLWHGASWNFVMWGGLHGLYLAGHTFLFGSDKRELTAPPKQPIKVITWLLKAFVTFNLVCIAWVFFRADSFMHATEYLRLIIAGGVVGIAVPLVYLACYGTAAVAIDLCCSFGEADHPISKTWPVTVKGVVYATLIFLMVVLGENDAQPFIYFQF